MRTHPMSHILVDSKAAVEPVFGFRFRGTVCP
jgi:hypothetical protein